MAAKLKDIGKIIQQALVSKKVMDVAGKSIVESMKKRIRVGKGVDDNLDGARKLKKLEKKTVKNRKAFVDVKTEKVERTLKDKFGRLLKGKKQNKKTKRTTTRKEGVDQQFFTPGKSNLTHTGQMINSIAYKAQRGKLSLFFDNGEAKRKAFHVQKNNPGFRFFRVSKAEWNRALKVMSKTVEDILSKIPFDGL